MRQLWLYVLEKDITILQGSNGCGKTFTVHFLGNALQNLNAADVHWCTYSTLPDRIKAKHDRRTVFIVDNFLGHTSFEGFPKWRPVYNVLRETLPINSRVLLVTRTSILHQARASTGADLADILNQNALVELSVDYETMYRNMLPGAKDTPDFNAIPDIGFPVCCKLASSTVLKKSCLSMFKNPSSFLREHIKDLMKKTSALLSLGLLAVTENYVNARELRNPAKLNKSIYQQVLQAMGAGNINDQRVADILAFYNETQWLIQVEDDFVSFTNEAIREAVLCVLCESHAQFLAEHCSLKLLSRLALVTRDPEQTTANDEKPTLPTSAREHFLDRLLSEMMLQNYSNTLTSALFEHPSFRRRFQANISEQSLIKAWLDTSDKKGLHFLFWANACKAFVNMLVTLKVGRNKEAIWQGVVGSCYWGNTNMLNELLSKQSQRKRNMLTAKIKDFFENAKELNWDEAPFHPEDTLLTLAAWRGKDDVVKELVRMGAEVNCSGHNDLTALMHYYAGGKWEMVTFLLGKGAVKHLQDDIGNTALHYALMGDLPSAAVDQFPVETLWKRNKRLQPPFVIACGCGASREVLNKLRAGIWQQQLYSSLKFTCYKGQTDVVKYLFETEDRNRPNLTQNDRIVEHVANALGCYKHEEMVQILLTKVASRTDSMVLRHLCHWLCTYKDDRALKTFMPVVKASFAYKIPLTLACIMGNKSVVEYLLDNQSSQANKQVVLQAAACMGSWDFMQWAMTATGTEVTMEIIADAMKFQQTELVKEFIKFYETKTGINPSFLHLAAKHDLVPVMKWLLDDKHKVPDSEDENGALPLSVAIVSGKVRAVKCLVNYGAKMTEGIKEDLQKHRATELKNDGLGSALERTVQYLVKEGSK